MAGARLDADLWISEYMSPWDVFAHGVERILVSKRTAFQDLAIVETGWFGKALVLDGKFQSCTADEFIYHEALVHPAMLAHGAPKRVLVLGGGEGATLREVLRWKSVEHATMVDIDGEAVEACREHLPEMHRGAFDDPRAWFVAGDALAFLDDPGEPWDVVISDLSDPIEDGPAAALFSREYFEKIRKALAPGGVLALQAGALNPMEVELHARLARTVASVFPVAQSYSASMAIYASLWGFLLAGGDGVALPSANDADALLAKQIGGEMRAVDGPFLEGMFRLPVYVRRAIETETRVLTGDASPSAFGKGTGGSRRD